MSDVKLRINGRKIALLRHALERTQEEIAREAAMSPSYIALLETGKRLWVGPSILSRLAAALRVQPSELLMEQKSPKDPDAPRSDEEIIEEYLDQYPRLRAGFAALATRRPSFVRRTLEYMIATIQEEAEEAQDYALPYDATAPSPTRRRPTRRTGSGSRSNAG